MAGDVKIRGQIQTKYAWIPNAPVKVNLNHPPPPPPQDMWGFSGVLSRYWQLFESPVCGDSLDPRLCALWSMSSQSSPYQCCDALHSASLEHLALKDVRANCFCASLLRTQIHMPRHATSCIERAR